MNISEQMVAEIVKRVVQALDGYGNPCAGSGTDANASAGAAFEKHIDPSGIMRVATSSVKPAPFDTGKSGDKVFLTDVSTLEESPRIGAGVMEMDHTDFDWTLKYDEWDYVIEGTLEIVINGRRVAGNAGDMIFIPANSSITFSCPTTCRFVYFVYPADWSNQ